LHKIDSFLSTIGANSGENLRRAMQFLLNWPVPISFLTVSVVTTSVALVGLYLVRRKYPPEVLKENHEVAAIIFNAFGLFYGVMVAFVVFVTWSGYDDATKNLQMEANQLADIFHSADAFPDPARKTIKQALRDYTASVYGDELIRMSQGEISLHSGGVLPRLMTTFYQMDEKSIANRELYAETLKRLNDLAQYRRLRIFAGNDTVPSAVWLVLLVGGVFTVSYTFFFGMKNIRAQYIMMATLTVTITLILFLIYVLDHPFTGTSKVSAEPLKEVMAIMEKE
jgi:Na+/proline symporter